MLLQQITAMMDKLNTHSCHLYSNVVQGEFFLNPKMIYSPCSFSTCNFINSNRACPLQLATDFSFIWDVDMKLLRCRYPFLACDLLDDIMTRVMFLSDYGWSNVRLFCSSSA